MNFNMMLRLKEGLYIGQSDSIYKVIYENRILAEFHARDSDIKEQLKAMRRCLVFIEEEFK